MVFGTLVWYLRLFTTALMDKYAAKQSSDFIPSTLTKSNAKKEGVCRHNPNKYWRFDQAHTALAKEERQELDLQNLRGKDWCRWKTHQKIQHHVLSPFEMPWRIILRYLSKTPSLALSSLYSSQASLFSSFQIIKEFAYFQIVQQFYESFEKESLWTPFFLDFVACDHPKQNENLWYVVTNLNLPNISH